MKRNFKTPNIKKMAENLTKTQKKKKIKKKKPN